MAKITMLEMNLERKKQKIEQEVAMLNVMLKQAGKKEKYKLVVE